MHIPNDGLMSKMQKAVENSMDGIALLDISGVYYYLNQVPSPCSAIRKKNLSVKPGSSFMTSRKLTGSTRRSSRF